MEKKRVGAGVGVFVLRDGRVLLGRRHDDPEKADSELHGEGTWTMPGGKLEFGESFEQAIVRELLEETGIQAKKIKLISVTNDYVGDAHFITLGFLCTDFEGEPKVMEPDEITEWAWFSLGDLPKKIFKPSEKIMKNFLENEIYKH